jgi:Dyp-type peroxidase family
MAKRAALLNDFGTSAPDEWFPAFTSDDLDALLIIASDTRADLDAEVSFQVERLAATGMRLLRIERGATRRDLPGHEHFGFKDGVSQPGIVGFTKNNSQDENQGDPGQDLLFPGEFVLGYSVQQPPPPTPKQDNGYPPKPAPTPAPGSGVHDPGPPPELKPVWTRNGSFLVFRRLSQDVPRFNDFLDKHAGNLGLVRLGSALVGRHKSGCPVEMIADLPTMATAGNVDPAIANPEVLDPRHINNFEFGADQVGTNVPLAAHIRKAYPRNQTHPGEQETQTHRLLRRGIPFGAPFVPGAAHDDPASETAPRGLLFLCYQASIERQFEFVQQSWVNKTDFPEPGQGIDPIIGQPATNTERHVTLPELPQPLGLEQFVRMTGGQYFFQPSISALRQLAASE